MSYRHVYMTCVLRIISERYTLYAILTTRRKLPNLNTTIAYIIAWCDVVVMVLNSKPRGHGQGFWPYHLHNDCDQVDHTCAPFIGGFGPPLIYGSFGLPESTHQTSSRSVRLFLQRSRS